MGSDSCVTATFNFDTTNTASTRQYDTSLTGTIASFNFPTNLDALGSTVTHLTHQNYHICFRRASGRCGICFIPSISITISADNTAASQSSFGLSFSPNDAIAKSDQEADCQ